MAADFNRIAVELSKFETEFAELEDSNDRERFRQKFDSKCTDAAASILEALRSGHPRFKKLVDSLDKPMPRRGKEAFDFVKSTFMAWMFSEGATERFPNMPIGMPSHGVPIFGQSYYTVHFAGHPTLDNEVIESQMKASLLSQIYTKKTEGLWEAERQYQQLKHQLHIEKDETNRVQLLKQCEASRLKIKRLRKQYEPTTKLYCDELKSFRADNPKYNTPVATQTEFDFLTTEQADNLTFDKQKWCARDWAWMCRVLARVIEDVVADEQGFRTDPKTRSVFLDGIIVADNLQPHLFVFAEALVEAHLEHGKLSGDDVRALGRGCDRDKIKRDLVDQLPEPFRSGVESGKGKDGGYWLDVSKILVR